MGDDTFDRFYLTAEDFFGIEGLTVKIGQFDIDFEGDDELYYDEHEDAGFFMELPYRGIQATKDFGLGEVSVFAASNVGDDGVSVYNGNDSDDIYGARLKVNFGEKAWLSANALFINTEDESAAEEPVYDRGLNYNVYWIGAGISIADGITLKGAYYIEDLEEDAWGYDGSYTPINYGDDPNAYKIILEVSQDVLKFTSLWVEYADFDGGFVTDNAPYAFHADLSDEYHAFMSYQDFDVVFVALKQEWNEKLSTFERYARYGFNYPVADTIEDWVIGVGYQYSPDLYFELAYDYNDIGKTCIYNGLEGFDEDGGIFRFRTLLTF